MALDDAGVQLIAQGVAAYVADMNKADNATSGFYKTLGDSDKSANSFQQVITGALRQVGAALVDFGIQGAKAIGGFVKDSIGLAGDFESGMLTFQSVAGKDVDAKGLEQFRDLFLQLGKELPVSTSEVQLAATEMVKGGIDPATIAAGGLRQNIQFAAAAMDGDLVKAAEISSKIMGGWTSVTQSASDKSAFLTHATDLLAKAANASSTDVEGLSLGIFNAQGIAKTAGVSFDDLTTTLAELAPRFASSSEAGTSLKNLIARLQPTTKPAIAAMEGLGLITEDGKNKFYDASGAFIGFQQASQILQGSLAGLTKQQQASVLQTIFGNDAMSAASALAELGASGYQSMADSLANANGVADAAALKQQGFNTALDNAKGSVEALQITIGSALLPILTELLNTVIAPAINSFTDWADAIFKADDPLQKLINQIDTFSPLLGTVVAAIADFVTSGGDLGVVADDLNEGMAGLGSTFLEIVSIGGMLVGGVQELVQWFSQASSASGDLGGALDDLNGIWNLALKTATDVGNGYLDIAESILPIVTQFWADHGTQIGAFLQGAYDHIMQIVNTALNLYDAIVPKVLGSVANWIEQHATGIQAVLSGAWDAISGIIDGALTLIEGVLKIALDVISGDWSQAWKDLQDMSVRVVQDLQQIISGFLNIIAGFFDTNLQEIASLWKHNWDAMVVIASTVATRMIDIGGDIVAGIQQGIADAWGSFTAWIHEQIMKIPAAVRTALGISSPSQVMADLVGMPIVQGIAVGMQAATPAMLQGITAIGKQMSTAFTDTDLAEALKELGLDAMAGFGAGIKRGVRSVISVINSTADTVEGAFRDAFGAHSPAERMIPVGDSIIQGIMEGLNSTWPALTDLVSTLSDDLISQVADLGSQIQGIIADSFGATATIDRTIAKNFDRLGNIGDSFLQDYIQQSLAAEQKIAETFTDPKAGAAYFKMVSDNIFETAALRKKIEEATDQDEKDRLNAQLIAISRAQDAERSQFYANMQAQANPLQGLIDQIGGLFQNSTLDNLQKQLAEAKSDSERARIQGLINANTLAVNDTGPGADLMALLNQLLMQLGIIPARADGGPVKADQPYWVGEHGPELFYPKMAGQIMSSLASRQSQPMSAMSMAQAGNSTTIGHQGAVINMPVYTNQSPSVIRDSMAIAQAALL